MSLKRGPTTELNHENWNDDEKEPDQKGSFAQAPPEELQNRTIKKAKRKFTREEQNDVDKPIFSRFEGFMASTATASTVSSTSSPFSFLSKLSSSTTQQSETKAATTTDNPDKEKSKNFQFDHSSIYYANLKALNQAVSKWIKQHVDENPLCILSPIFQDYEKYLVEIKDKAKNGKSQDTPSLGSVSSVSQASSFKSPTVTTSNTSGISSSNTFTFSSMKNDKKLPETSVTIAATETTTTTATTSSMFSGNSKFPFVQSNDANKPSTFSFGSNKPFTFGSIQQTNSSTSLKSNEENKDNTEEGDGDDEPPKVEFKPIEEEGSVYSKRLKVFIKNDKNYKDLGIGTLHLKPLKGEDKTQLLCRADTNIGKILLNLILNEGIPTQRMGKNNVMMICIPTPPDEADQKPETGEKANQKPVTVLLRVKTGEEADELLETINKYKK